jgi:hypothetical protein
MPLIRVRVTFGRHSPLSMAKATFPCAIAWRHGHQVKQVRRKSSPIWECRKRRPGLPAGKTSDARRQTPDARPRRSRPHVHHPRWPTDPGGPLFFRTWSLKLKAPARLFGVWRLASGVSADRPWDTRFGRVECFYALHSSQRAGEPLRRSVTTPIFLSPRCSSPRRSPSCLT